MSQALASPTTIWMTTAEIAAYTKRNIKTIQRALSAGHMRGAQTTTNGCWRATRDDVDAWVRGERASTRVAPMRSRRSA